MAQSDALVVAVSPQTLWKSSHETNAIAENCQQKVVRVAGRNNGLRFCRFLLERTKPVLRSFDTSAGRATAGDHESDESYGLAVGHAELLGVPSQLVPAQGRASRQCLDPHGRKRSDIGRDAGPGAITHIWTTHRGGGRDLILRAYWDGSDHPSIEAPLGDFFGVAMGVNAPMNSLPIQVSSEGRSRNCWWYMPFNQSARVTVSATRSEENLKRSTVPMYLYIDYQVYGAPVEDLNYFHARFIETDPAQRGKPVKLAQMEGNGHFVGVVMGQRGRTPGWFGEGDDMITVDGELSFWGTGTEDYFCDAWGFRVFSDLYHGLRLCREEKWVIV